MNKGRGVPLSAGSVVSSFCFSDDLLVVRRKPEVVEDGAALDEPMVSRSEAANDGVAGTAPVRWTVATVEHNSEA